MSSNKISPEFSKFLLDLREILNRVDAESEESALPVSEKEAFKENLLDEYLGQFIESIYFRGEIWLFKGKESLLRDLKLKVAEFFKTDVENIYIVGSAKTGFSITKTKDFREGIEGVKNSDIDIAIVDTKCFENYHQQIGSFHSDYMERPMLSGRDNEKLQKSKNYLTEGWIRPDLLFPKELQQEWMNFFDSISDGRFNSDLNYRINGGLYLNQSCFSRFSRKSLKHKLEDLIKLAKQVENDPLSNDLTPIEPAFKAFLYLMCPFHRGDEKLVHNLVEMMDITLEEFDSLKEKFIAEGLLKLIGDQIYFEDEDVGKEAVNYLINQEKTDPAQIIELSNIYEQ